MEASIFNGHGTLKNAGLNNLYLIKYSYLFIINLDDQQYTSVT